MAFNLINTDNVSDNATLYANGLDSPATAVIDGTTYLFTSGFVADGVSVFSVDSRGLLANVANSATKYGDSIWAPLATAVVDTKTYLYAATFDNISDAFSVGASGTLSRVPSFASGLHIGIEWLTTAVVDGRTYLFAGASAESEISVYSVGADGRPTNVANVSDSAILHVKYTNVGITATVDDITYLFAFSGNERGLSVFSVGADGALTNVANLSDNHPSFVSAVTTAVVGGTTYLFEGGFSDSGISAFAVGTDGSLTKVAYAPIHGSVTTMATVVSDGTTYLFAGRVGDSGLSAFAVGADGSLTNTLDVADSATLHLASPHLVPGTVEGVPYLFVQSHDDSGVSVFRVENDPSPPVAKDDSFATTENVAVGGVFTDNGAGADSDPENDPFFVAAVNGSVLALGQQITLPSGARVTVGANGDLVYDPSSAFDSLPAPGSGASNSTTGVDTFTYTLAATPATATNATGATATVAVTVTGIDSNDILRDSPGIDNLTGGIGNDQYYVSNTGDVVNEVVGGGNDRVLASVGYTLAAGQEIETLSTDNDAGTNPINLTGNEFANTLISNRGVDTLVGLGGDDLYFVNNTADVVTEAVGGGNDRVFAGVSHALAAGQEIETLSTDNDAGTNPIDLTGNAFTQIIVGNAGRNTLVSLAGVDTMIGLGGDDRYFVNHAADVVNEAVGRGNDRVLTSVSYALAAGLEIETLSTDDDAGTSAINLTGNEFANTLISNRGVDTLIGLSGDDRYFVNNAADVVNEAVGRGNDRVLASVSYALAAGQQIEALSTDNDAGTSPIDLTGNEFNNTLTGNRGDNLFAPGAGSDIVAGLGGSNTVVYADAAGGVFIDLTSIKGMGTAYEGAVGASFRNGAAGVPVASTDTLFAISNAVGSSFDDRIYGTPGDNLIRPGSGADMVDGLGGTDTIDYSDAAGGVFVYLNYVAGIGAVDEASAGASFHNGAAGVQVASTDYLVNISNANGSAFDDRIYGTTGDNLIRPGSGADMVDSLGGSDTIDYSDAAGGVFVYLDYGAGIGVVDEASAGASFRNGATGVTVASTDILVDIPNAIGSAFDDRIYGTAGDNLIAPGAGTDVVDGLGGSDTIDYAGAAGGVFIDLDYGSGIGAVYEGTAGASFRNGATGVALASTDVLVAIANANGSAFDDRINGATAGGALNGGGGDDVIYGAAGADRLNGGDNNDILIGRGGSDIFVFDAALSAAGNVDQIVDFTLSTGAPAEVDAIELDHAIFGLPVGALAAAAFATGAPTTADQRILYDTATGALSYDDDGNGVHAATQFAALITLPAGVSAADFLVI